MTELLDALLAAGIDEVPIVYLDVETTGLHPDLGDRVVEIGALRCEGGEVLDAMQQLVNPQRYIGRGALAVHGITADMVADAPTFAQVATHVLGLLSGAIFVGHNAPFDLGFLAQELALAGISMPPMIALCTLRLSRRFHRLPSHSLANVTEALGIEVVGETHRAFTDVLLTKALFERISDTMWRQGVRTVRDYVTQQGGPIQMTSSPPVEEEVPEAIREALADRCLLALRYRAEGGTETQRIVRPYRVVRRGGKLLLQGHCLLRNEERTFRIDRIIEIDVIDELA
jgi:DNA polymerase III subunit epsilon